MFKQSTKFLLGMLLTLAGTAAWGEVEFKPYGDPNKSAAAQQTREAQRRLQAQRQRAADAAEQAAREKAQQEDEAKWQALTDQAALGEAWALRALTTQALKESKPEKMRPGLAKAAQNGSQLAQFLSAALDYNTAASKSNERNAASAAVLKLKGYPLADYWYALRGQDNASTESIRAELDNAVSRYRQSSPWMEYLWGLSQCRNAAWGDCLKILQESADKGIIEARLPLAAAFLATPSTRRDMTRARALLDSFGPKGPEKNEGKLLLALSLYRGWGGAVDVSRAREVENGMSGRSYTRASNRFYGPSGKKCGGFQWMANSASYTNQGNFSAGFGVSEPAIETLDGYTTQQALDACAREAAGGNKDALAWLGVAYSRCLVSCDTEKARDAFVRASDAGSDYADHWLAAHVTEKTVDRARVSRDRIYKNLSPAQQLAIEYNFLKATKAPKSEFEYYYKSILSFPKWQNERGLLPILWNIIRDDGVQEAYPGAGLTYYALFLELLSSENEFSANVKDNALFAPPTRLANSWKNSGDTSTYFLGVAQCAAWSTTRWDNSGWDCGGKFTQ